MVVMQFRIFLSSRFLSKSLKIKIYSTIILPVVLYGCETWSLILREERRLRVFEKRVLGRIFGSKRDEVTGGWRKLHNEELHNLYTLSNIIMMISRRIRWEWHVACTGGKLDMRTRFWLESLKRRDHSEDLDIDGRIILK
jgi:hypothetical protein